MPLSTNHASTAIQLSIVIGRHGLQGSNSAISTTEVSRTVAHQSGKICRLEICMEELRTNSDSGEDGVSWTHEADHSMQRAHLIVSATTSETIKGMQTRERVALLPVLRVSEGKEQFQPLANADLHRRRNKYCNFNILIKSRAFKRIQYQYDIPSERDDETRSTSS